MLLAAPAVAAPPAAEVVRYDPRTFTCPIGGRPFEQDVGYFALPLVTLPDGSWLGDSEIDAQIPVCPDNGLVLQPDYERIERERSQSMAYRDYSAAELARLPGLIADPAYAALKADGRHVQAHWLATRLGLPARHRFLLLQRATWAATAPALRRRLIERLAAEGPALIEAAGLPEPGKRLQLFYVVNALRELGRFDEATALLAKIEAARPVGGEVRDALATLAPAMRLAIAGKDDGRFPVELLDRRLVSDLCEGKARPPYDQRTPGTLAACKTRREREAREAAAREAATERSAELTQDREKLVAQCAAPTVDKNDLGLALACDSLAEERAAAEANKLVLDGPALAAACDATPEDKQEGALAHACSSYSTAVEFALGSALAEDDQAWAILCPGGGEADFEDRDRRVSMACGAAGTRRKERAVEAMMADPAKLDAMCTRPRDEMEVILFSACLERKSRKRDARVEALAAGQQLFERDCGRFAGRLANTVSGGDEEEEICRNAYNLRENRKAQAAAAAKGLVCYPDVIYSPDRPTCVPKAEHDAEMARGIDPGDAHLIDPRFEEGSSLMKAAHAAAAAIVARAKAVRAYPGKRPGDRW